MQRFPAHRAPRLRLLGGLADLPEGPVLQAVLLPSEFQEHVPKQCTLDVVVTTAEAPCIKSNAMETLRTTPTVLLHRIARQIRPIKLLDTALPCSSTAKQTDAEWRLMPIGFDHASQRQGKVPVPKSVLIVL
ncbi:hypothetical protein [Paraburkholderia sp. BL6669N2]|uniref:hypothetical protein n=1 Tax=Paraburkholderia sp. BL6669N2 TaxID=1938807 RepID=UPI0038D3B853